MGRLCTSWHIALSEPEKDNRERRLAGMNPEWLKQYAAVLEFLGMLAVAGYAGWWLEERYGWQPWGLLGGLLVGMSAGLYRLVRQMNRLNK